MEVMSDFSWWLEIKGSWIWFPVGRQVLCSLFKTGYFLLDINIIWRKTMGNLPSVHFFSGILWHKTSENTELFILMFIISQKNSNWIWEDQNKYSWSNQWSVLRTFDHLPPKWLIIIYYWCDNSIVFVQIIISRLYLISVCSVK